VTTPEARAPIPEVTASAIVFSADLQRICLVRHRRLRVWLCPGGHVISGEDLEECVIREVREETGLSIGLVTWAADTELRVHNARATSLTRPLTLLRIVDADRGPYTDVVFVAFANDAAELVSPRHEVDDVRWIAVSGLPLESMPEELPRLIHVARRRVAAEGS
jgi:ADP-ribose pyrophosphatase YjhB (NUDIX family)